MHRLVLLVGGELIFEKKYYTVNDTDLELLSVDSPPLKTIYFCC